MKAGFVPILRAESDDKTIELVPGLAEPRQQVVAQTLSGCDGSLCELHPSLPPFLLRECLDVVRRSAAFRRRGIPPQCTGDVTRVIIRHPDKMRHDITDFPECTGTGLGPGVL